MPRLTLVTKNVTGGFDLPSPGGEEQVVKVAHLRLCYSRAFFLVAYPRESQEMVFDAHARAFAFLGGVPQRGIYDNMKPAVDAIFTGRARRYNRRFLVMCNNTGWRRARDRAAARYQDELGQACPAGFRSLRVHACMHA